MSESGKLDINDILGNRCLVHKVPMHSTDSRSADGKVVHSFLSCPMCNADVIDRWAKQPGTITVNVRDGKVVP